MRPEDAKKLLGGYATGTLTDAEQQALFAAALEDQELFDAIAGEQSLREVLADPAVKAELLAALEERPRQWWSWRPAAVLAMAGLAAVAVVVVRQNGPAPRIVAEVKVAAPAAPSPVLADKAAEKAPEPAAPVKRKATVARHSAAGQVGDLPNEKQAFERQPIAGGVIGGVPTVAATPRLSMLPMDNAAPMRMQEQSQVQVVTTGAREAFLGTGAPGPMFAASAAGRTMGLRYSVLRKEGENFVETDAGALRQDDVVELRFTANTNGYLSIDGATPVAITAMQPYTTAAVDGAEVKVVFARTPETSAEGSVVTERRQRETYVAGTAPGPAISFTITLKRN
jgi:hypothetical protein